MCTPRERNSTRLPMLPRGMNSTRLPSLPRGRNITRRANPLTGKVSCGATTGATSPTFDTQATSTTILSMKLDGLNSLVFNEPEFATYDHAEGERGIFQTPQVVDAVLAPEVEAEGDTIQCIIEPETHIDLRPDTSE